jgi:hypothetical protein
MGWSNKIDVMASLPLKMKHHAGKGFGVFGVYTAFTQMADFPVLTENAEKIAVGYKDST